MNKILHLCCIWWTSDAFVCLFVWFLKSFLFWYQKLIVKQKQSVTLIIRHVQLDLSTKLSIGAVVCAVYLSRSWSLLLSLPIKRDPQSVALADPPLQSKSNASFEELRSSAQASSCARFHFQWDKNATENNSCLTHSNTELSNVDVTLETKVLETWAGQPPSGCYDYNSLQ